MEENKKAPLTLLRLKPKTTTPPDAPKPPAAPHTPSAEVGDAPQNTPTQSSQTRLPLSGAPQARSPAFLKLLRTQPAADPTTPRADAVTEKIQTPHPTKTTAEDKTLSLRTPTDNTRKVSQALPPISTTKATSKHTPSFLARIRKNAQLPPVPSTTAIPQRQSQSIHKPTNTSWNRGGAVQQERTTHRMQDRERTPFKQHNSSARKPRVIQHISRTIEIPESISITALASEMAVQANKVVVKLKRMGMTVGLDSTLDAETAAIVIEEFGHTHKYTPRFNTEFEGLPRPEQALKPRCPIVTIAGHVDHGKTSILDTIRNTKVAAGEHGGITQSIGAYQIDHNGKQITFIDTPGHLAFSKMREHGIRITDIALLIVAADDSVQEQTIESIRHIQGAKTPMIVVINKIDLPGANPQRVATDLLQHGVVVESMGGDVMSVEISAKTGKNLDQLLDTILVQAEMMDLDTIHTGPGRGVILESDTVKGLGPCATVLLNRGTLNIGDYFVSGTVQGKARSISDSAGKRLKSAGVSQPVKIAGFQSPPDTGSTFGVVKNEQAAQELIDARIAKRNLIYTKDTRTVHDIFAQESVTQNLSFVVNASSQGMLDAMTESIKSVTHKHLSAVVVQSKVGPVTAGDVELAKITNSEIIGFQVEPTSDAQNILKQYKINFANHKIIYKAVEYVVELLRKRALEELLSTVSGHAEIIRIFDVKGVGCVVGCKILSGEVAVKDIVAVHKKGKETYRGNVESIQQETKQVQVATDGEYGIIIKSDSGNIYKNVSVGNQLMFYKTAPGDQK
jgi:translation initiation factor IF-2